MILRHLYGMALVGLLLACMAAGGTGTDAPVEDAAVRQAIEAGRDWLLRHQNRTAGDPNEGSWIAPGANPDAPADRETSNENAGSGSPVWAKFKTGETALIVYALIETGLTPQDKRVKLALDWLLKSQQRAERKRKRFQEVFMRLGQVDRKSEEYQRLLAMGEESYENTYNVSLRANAFAAAIRRAHHPEYRAAMARDVERLIDSANRGSYGYVCMPAKLRVALAKKRGHGGDLATASELFRDNSNSQYGLLGVWAGLRSGGEVPSQYWQEVERHWKTNQNDDGGWGYPVAPFQSPRPGSHPSMTAAGIASLYVCLDNLKARQFIDCKGRTVYDQHLQGGLDWIEERFKTSLDPDASLAPPGAEKPRASVFRLSYYYLYGIERIALASGYKRIGGVNWYNAGANYILQKQETSGSRRGSWYGRWVDGWRPGATAYALLFLARGQRPVLFNKLAFEGDWNNRPRDLATLTRWMSDKFEGDLNWQIVQADEPLHEWQDAPILYLSASRAPTFTDEQKAKLRDFVYQGGTIFSAAECGGKPFTAAMADLYAELFKPHELTPVAPDHGLYSVHRKLGGRPKLSMIHNGVRPLAVHCEQDLSRAWQLSATQTQQDKFEVASNLFLYVTDKGRLRNRGVRTWIPPVQAPGDPVRLAVVAHGGNDNPEPLALTRLARLVGRDAGVAAEAFDPLAPTDLAGKSVQLAVLTGTGKCTLSADDLAALNSFVDGGGTLLATGAAGSETFYHSAKDALGKAFGGDFTPLPTDAALYDLPGGRIGEVRYRQTTPKRNIKGPAPRIEALAVGGRPAVLLSREDLLAGWLGAACAEIDGYDVASAEALGRNLVLQAGKRQAGRTIEPQVAGKGFRARRDDDTGRHVQDTRAPWDEPSAEPAPPETKSTDSASDDPPAPRPDDVVSWQDAGKHIGRKVTVEGSIVGGNDIGAILFLNFSRNRGDFYCVIFKSDKNKFPDEPHRHYRGKKVRVTGTINKHKGKPQMILRDPKQIQVVGG